MSSTGEQALARLAVDKHRELDALLDQRPTMGRQEIARKLSAELGGVLAALLAYYGAVERPER